MKLDQHEIKQVGNEVEIKRTTIELYDAEEYLRVLHALKEQKKKLDIQIKQDITKTIKEIRQQKKEERLNTLSVLQGINGLEKEMQKVRRLENEKNMKKALDATKKEEKDGNPNS